jgi:inosose dehydratase
MSASRRGFLGSAAAAAGALFAAPAWSGAKPARKSTLELSLGYAAITWAGKDEQAIEEIAALGFRGIQLRSNVVERYGERPEELKRKLDEKGLALLCFSSGTVDAVPGKAAEYSATHVRHARFVKALGGSTLQLLSRRPQGRAPAPAEFARLGRLLDEIGRRTQELGVQLVYHNHMRAFGEAPDEVARVLDATDSRYVSLLLDIAHYQQGGGDPVAAVARHRDRLKALHLKDVVSPLPGDTKPARESYTWVELGRGKVDVLGVVRALEAIRWSGPALIELDAPTDGSKTAADCAAINKEYAVSTLGLSL